MKIKINSELIAIMWRDYEDQELVEDLDLNDDKYTKAILGEKYGGVYRTMLLRGENGWRDGEYVLFGKEEYIEELYEKIVEILSGVGTNE